ncbi:pyruvate dehydrogenase complex dihydrolipoamide acetyltransferase [Actinoallomurus bryophytorum]|uniref:Dihydrolipoamide acetyltransferase component of pyruvate dehydrogenase complex n=1 Tax=Actinoallomurus bryophytorum TaxID=1490222 RepID=A0A543CW09_9ACTN|nr:dihydrolipoamide acetyltransferase family protein [Actinoallomurus bryophytorum]TQM01294.1 pyruvate dehydrogenase E2 component (dihydrolipoamide acetyltransferase) [Actinoallomurus bryophytorum]
MSEILMPRLSDTMEEGVVSSWHKKPGDKVSAGDALVDIETDKALMEYEAYEDGVLGEILVAEGGSATIGTPIAVLVTDGSAPAAAPAEAPAQAPAANGTPVRTEPAAPAAEVPAARNGRSRPPSSPLARRIARENGVDLTTLTGSGPGGRIIRADVEAATLQTAVLSTQAVVPPAPPSAPPAATAPAEAARPQDADTEQVPLSRIRKVTARRLAESMRTAPHFYLTRVVDVEELLAFRATLNTALAPAKVSVNDLIVKACATALRANPVLNVSFTEEALLVHKRVHIGVAVALEEGLVVPVIRDADRKSVSQLGAETRELAGRAREQRLTPQEMSGGTFTVSNLGMFGVDAFTAVINPPEAAILAVGATRKDVVFRDGEVIPRDRMTLTLSIDHRACDGATGAAFLGQLTDLLENPFRIVA